MKLFVNDQAGEFVAMINKQPKLAQGYRPEEPWLLLYKTGRTERFPTQREAKLEARKSWINCRFEKGGA